MSSLSVLNITHLKKVARGLKIRGYSKYTKATKQDLEALIERTATSTEIDKAIGTAIHTRTSNKQKQTGSWVKLRRIGSTGKDGKVYNVVNEQGDSMAMKTFRKNKNIRDMKREIAFQIKASDGIYQISPKIVEYNFTDKYVVMEKLDRTLIDVLEDQDGVLHIDQQKSIIDLFTKLDQLEIFHNDANPLNIMTSRGKWYMIDYGFACNCSHNDVVGIESPNLRFMTVGLLTGLARNKFDVKTYTYLTKFVSKSVLSKITSINESYK